MSSSATLIGFQDQGNLGIGYLAATLARHGFTVRVLDFRLGEEAIAETIRSTQPTLVGFSLIFQYYLPQFARLAEHLRSEGVNSHFTVGGHYPTVSYEHLLQTVPELDSAVRGEGELTLLELMQRLSRGQDWRDLAGIAYRNGDQCIATPPRPLLADLDGLPHPDRPLESLEVLCKKASPLLASRGCSRDCSFCSIREFYARTPGKKVRVRAPEAVAREMKELYEERGVSIFLFQDDDFPLWRGFGHRWVERFLAALRAEDLLGRIIWKLSCRADQVERDLFQRMRDAGLYMVYLGLESGTAAGLRVLNKQLTVQHNLQAVELLLELDLALAYGFMLFDPSSTFDSVRANVSFLRRIGQEGTLPAVFCRMLPYAGTPIERSLLQEGRLRGSLVDPSYDFLDPRLDTYFKELHEVVADWIHGPNALSASLNWAWQEYWVMRRLCPPLQGMAAYELSLRDLTRSSNHYILDLLETSSSAFEQGRSALPPVAEFQAKSRTFAEQMLTQRNAFVARNQDTLLAGVA